MIGLAPAYAPSSHGGSVANEEVRMACRTGCPTQDHASWGECARASNMRVAFCGIGGGDATKQKKWDAELQSYRDARAQGIEPASTRTRDIRAAVELSNMSGTAFSAANPV